LTSQALGLLKSKTILIVQAADQQVEETMEIIGTAKTTIEKEEPVVDFSGALQSISTRTASSYPTDIKQNNGGQ